MPTATSAGANMQTSAITSTLTRSGAAAANWRERVNHPRTAWRPGRDDCCCVDPISLPCTETCIAHHRLHPEVHNQMPRECRHIGRTDWRDKWRADGAQRRWLRPNADLSGGTANACVSGAQERRILGPAHAYVSC